MQSRTDKERWQKPTGRQETDGKESTNENDQQCQRNEGAKQKTEKLKVHAIGRKSNNAEIDRSSAKAHEKPKLRYKEQKEQDSQEIVRSTAKWGKAKLNENNFGRKL